MTDDLVCGAVEYAFFLHGTNIKTINKSEVTKHV